MLFYVKVLEKLSTVPPVSPDVATNLTVTWRNKQLVVEASSPFEAATKFAFCLHEFGYVTNCDMLSEIEVMDANDNKYIYNVILRDNMP